MEMEHKHDPAEISWCEIGEHDVAPQWVQRCVWCKRFVCVAHSGDILPGNSYFCQDHKNEVTFLDRVRGRQQEYRQLVQSYLESSQFNEAWKCFHRYGGEGYLIIAHNYVAFRPYRIPDLEGIAFLCPQLDKEEAMRFLMESFEKYL